MAFKPKNANATSSGNFEQRNYPVPKAGARKARVSLIVDLGVQEREDFEDTTTGEKRPQKPCQQLAVFADLVNDVVDYGGSIGKQQYRLLLNNSFAGDIKGINFQAVPPKDANGELIAGKPWTLHPASPLTKLAKATNRKDVIESMDVEQLLGLAFMATVEVNEKDSGKVDKNDEPIIYKNVNFKGASLIPMAEDEDGNEVEPVVKELTQPARLISFDDATADDIQFIRGKLLNMIKLANNYAGSQMQKAVEEYEANKPAQAAQEPADDSAAEPEDAPAKPAKVTKAPAKKPAAKPVEKEPAKPTEFSDMDDDIPF